MSLTRPVAPNPYELLPTVDSFQVVSSDFEAGDTLPLAQAFGPDEPGGNNQSPALAWSGSPAGTASFVITCFDPDAPTPSGFWHWLAIDIPADVTAVTSNAGQSDATLPRGAFHVRNDFGNHKYDGCAPPSGDPDHRYFFVIHAVDVPTLGVTAAASPAFVSFNLAFHTLGRAIITGKFSL